MRNAQGVTGYQSRPDWPKRLPQTKKTKAVRREVDRLQVCGESELSRPIYQRASIQHLSFYTRCTYRSEENAINEWLAGPRAA